MTIEEAIQDFKQYIDVSIGQRLDGLATKEDVVRVEEELAGVKVALGQVQSETATKSDLQETQEAIAETLTTAVDSVASKEQVGDHERRITRLEHHVA